MLKHEAGLVRISQPIYIAMAKRESIKNNHVGEILEQESVEFSTDYPTEYHYVTRDLITNEIFRRVDPKQRTFGEFIPEDLLPLLRKSVKAEMKPSIKMACGLTNDQLKECFNLSIWSQTRQILGMLVPKWFNSIYYLGVFDHIKYLKEIMVKQSDLDRRSKKLNIMKNFNMNSELWRQSEIPSRNIHSNASTLGTLAAFMAGKGKLGET